MKKLILFTVAIFLYLNANCQTQQSENTEKPFPRFNLGLGGGLDYGGFGLRGTVVASQRFEIFGALGYNLLGVGFNGGIDLRILPTSRICPYIGAMYGYNAVIKITGMEEANQTYYGPTFALGFEFWSRRKPNFFNLELLIPIRSSEFHSDYTNIKNNPNIEMKSEIIPVGFAIGYHFTL